MLWPFGAVDAEPLIGDRKIAFGPPLGGLREELPEPDPHSPVHFRHTSPTMYTTVAYRRTSLVIRTGSLAIMKSECIIAQNGGDLGQFQVFLRALAARSAQLLNLADLGRDLGLALNTVKAWLSVLEASHQVIILRPYFANVGTRLVKTPKVYFTDTGVLCYLTGLKDPEHAASGPLAGAIVETAVVIRVR